MHSATVRLHNGGVTRTGDGPPDEAFTDAVVTASRVLVAIAARSMTVAEGVTLPQYRTLVVLASRGPQSLQHLADELGVAPSTASRMCDRLVAKALIDRAVVPGNRREVQLGITTKGATIVNAVTRRRRAEIKKIITQMPAKRRTDLITALESFAAAAGETPDDQWFLGWA